MDKHIPPQNLRAGYPAPDGLILPTGSSVVCGARNPSGARKGLYTCSLKMFHALYSLKGREIDPRWHVSLSALGFLNTNAWRVTPRIIPPSLTVNETTWSERLNKVGKAGLFVPTAPIPGEYCGVRSGTPRNPGFCCTRVRGHRGYHMSYTSDGKLTQDSWPRSPLSYIHPISEEEHEVVR